MSEKRFTIHKESKYKEEGYAYPFCIKEDGEVVLETIPLYIAEKVRDKLNEQEATIQSLKEENEQLKNELRKEKSLREYSDSMYGADLIVNIRFSNGEWKADVSVIDDE